MPPVLEVFIGSSRALRTAQTVKKILDDHAEVTLWRDAFEPGTILLANIVSLVSKFDFGVFVFNPDDLAEMLYVTICSESEDGRAPNPRNMRHSLSGVISAMKRRGPAPRNDYIELLSLRTELEEREIRVGSKTYSLLEPVRAAARARRRPWNTLSPPRELFSYLKEHGYARKLIDETYWWLVVMGVLRFGGIDNFTSSKGWEWKHSIPYVLPSERGARLLNQLQESKEK